MRTGAGPATTHAHDEVERAAWQDLIRACPPDVARRLRLRCSRVGPALVVRAPMLPDPSFNRAFCFTRPPDDAVIGAVLAAAGDGPDLELQVGSAVLDDRGADILRARGFVESGRFALLARSVTEVAEPPSALRVEEAGPADRQRIAEAYVAAWDTAPVVGAFVAGVVGRSGWVIRIMRDADGTVAALGMGFQRGDTQWLGFASTTTEHRCRGAQSLLIARRVNAARAAGVTRLVTDTRLPARDEAPNPSLNNLLRAGFTITGERVCWRLVDR